MLAPVRGTSRRLSLRGGLALSFALSAVVSSAAGGQQASPSTKTHTVKRGDTLWDIAKLYLTDPFLWPEVYRLNTDVIEDPHWIYPGEVLKLPGEQAKVVAAVEPSAPAPAPTAAPVTPQAPPPSPAPRDSAVVVALVQAPTSAVRTGEYVAAPWVDQNGGPRNHGYIVESAELPGIASADRSRVRLYDRVFVAQPDAATGRKLYLTYRLGPMLPDFGQIVIPTGVIEVPRPAQPGEAAVGRVVRMFDEMLQGQRLIPLDTSAALVAGRPTAVPNGMRGMVRWVGGEPVLGTIQTYVVIDISRKDSLSVGDRIELYQPRKKPAEGRELALPEISIAQAQVLRVTERGATAIVISQEQPKIEQGGAVRIVGKMP